MSSKAHAIAVFDISSSSVGGAHALIQHEGDTTAVSMLIQERRDSGLEEELDVERFLNDTAKALEVVIDHVRTADVHHPERIQVVLASPWYSSYTRTITYNKTTFFSCTERLVASLIEKEITFLLKQPDTNGAAFGTGFKVVEQQLAQVSLNGYPTIEPYGKKVQSLELTLIVTLVPQIVADRFTGIIRRSYGDRPISVTTGSHAAFVALRDNGGIEKESVIVDVGEEITDIGFVKNGLFTSQHSFPVGTYELYRALSTVTGSTLEARALVEGYRLKKLSPSNTRIVEKALLSFSHTWIKALKHISEEGKSGFYIPAHWYICADDRFETLFTTIIAQDQFLVHQTVSQKIQVVFVNEVHVSAKVSGGETIDAALLLGALFMERLL